jgi:hypothetical protein
MPYLNKSKDHAHRILVRTHLTAWITE